MCRRFAHNMWIVWRFSPPGLHHDFSRSRKLARLPYAIGYTKQADHVGVDALGGLGYGASGNGACRPNKNYRVRIGQTRYLVAAGR
jgi:hypothetical protein